MENNSNNQIEENNNLTAQNNLQKEQENHPSKKPKRSGFLRNNNRKESKEPHNFNNTEKKQQRHNPPHQNKRKEYIKPTEKYLPNDEEVILEASKLTEEPNKYFVFNFLKLKTGRNFKDLSENINILLKENGDLNIKMFNQHLINYSLNLSPVDTFEYLVNLVDKHIDWEKYFKPEAIFIALFKSNEMLNKTIEIYENKFGLQFTDIEKNKLIRLTGQHVFANDKLNTILSLFEKINLNIEQKKELIKVTVEHANVNLFRALINKQDYKKIVFDNFIELNLQTFVDHYFKHMFGKTTIEAITQNPSKIKTEEEELFPYEKVNQPVVKVKRKKMLA